ncbi:MAG: restriction endonuclease subunit M [Muribaculaceae bacterium]|nr:restriction endonuclease subunit M [Muribaculaceae bacterium]
MKSKHFNALLTTIFILYFCNIQNWWVLMSADVEQNEDIDILEQEIQDISPFLLKMLLQDKTTGHFIRFACDEYLKYGEAYAAEKEIFPELIIGSHTKIIQPRTAKSKDEQINRTRKAAEVFTPSWICNEMNNHCDEQWFGRSNVFNTPKGHDWIPNPNPIIFPEDSQSKRASWMKYVDSKRLEITCGEAPYLVSRYDTTTGEFLPLKKRIGILDRKLRVVGENTNNETDWFKWAKRAFESTYGYEYQGDNLLLARENLLWTFIDYYKSKFNTEPTLVQKKQIANVIVWNVWQMDGLNDTVPFCTTEDNERQLELFDNLPKIYTPILCKIKDWRSDRVFYFQDLKKGTKNEI